MVRAMIHGFWHGPRLTDLCRLSIGSYLANGHEYTLWTYTPVEGIPDGVIHRDAQEIIPPSDIGKFQNLANFSDWFRYWVLLKQGGWWSDMDVLCLRPYNLTQEHVFALESSDPFLVCGNVLKAPADSSVMKWCIDEVA